VANTSVGRSSVYSAETTSRSSHLVDSESPSNERSSPSGVSVTRISSALRAPPYAREIPERERHREISRKKTTTTTFARASTLRAREMETWRSSPVSINSIIPSQRCLIPSKLGVCPLDQHEARASQLSLADSHWRDTGKSSHDEMTDAQHLARPDSHRAHDIFIFLQRILTIPHRASFAPKFPLLASRRSREGEWRGGSI
jgi:hypothetical protein